MKPLAEVFWVFLRLGLTAFGGPAAHIALMQEEFVMKREWIAHEEFLDLISAANLIPGPNSTEVAIHIGYRRAGWLGLLVAGTCFILPAALIVALLASLYVRFGSLPSLQGILYGVKPVVLAVVSQAIFGLAKSALKTRFLILIALLALGVSLLGVNELLVLFGAGALAGIGRFAVATERPRPSLLPLAFLLVLALVVSYLLPHRIVSGGVFSYFVQLGSVLYGSGYVLLAFLREGLVGHGLSEAQLLDAVAIGQVTPGPVFTTATFIGYVMEGPKGAFLATVGIFLPAFVFVAVTAPFLSRLRQLPSLAGFLDGTNVASLAMMTSVCFLLAKAALVDVPTLLLGAVGAVLLIRFKVSSAWLLLGSAALGWILRH